jgi:hypothetical protein
LPSNLRMFSSFSGHSSRTVQLLPIPSDHGCSQHYGNAQLSFSFNIYDDLTCVATSLNSRNPVQQELPVADSPPPPQHRVPGQQEVFEVDWRELAVVHPLNQHHFGFTLPNSESFGFRFKAAVPSAEFLCRAKMKSQDGAAKQSFRGMSKNQKKKAQARAKKSSAALSGLSAEDSSLILQPSDIARVRLFLCFHSDVLNGSLPANHMEIDHQRPLADSIAEFEKKFEGRR